MKLLEYALVFVAAAVPGIEIALVIPAGIVRGLSPFWVLLLAFAGNLLTVLLLIAGFAKLEAWMKQKLQPPSGRRAKQMQRAKRIMNKYGLPGLALLGPLVIGSHIAAFIGLSLGASPRWTVLWMTISIGVWTLGVGISSILGFEWFVNR